MIERVYLWFRNSIFSTYQTCKRWLRLIRSDSSVDSWKSYFNVKWKHYRPKTFRHEKYKQFFTSKHTIDKTNKILYLFVCVMCFSLCVVLHPSPLHISMFNIIGAVSSRFAHRIFSVRINECDIHKFWRCHCHYARSFVVWKIYCIHYAVQSRQLSLSYNVAIIILPSWFSVFRWLQR